VNFIAEGKQYAKADVPYRRGETVDLVAKENVDGLVDGNSRVECGVRVFEDLPASARPGTKRGEVVVRVDGERVGESPLVARNGYEEASLWERVWYTVSSLWK